MILHKRDEWQAQFRAGWLANWQRTGEFDWKQYPRPHNEPLPPSSGVDLSQSRLLLISTARALEMNGIATTLTSWHHGRTRPTMPPRATLTRLARGATLGRPGDASQQWRVLRATLSLLAQDGPLDPVVLDEQYDVAG